MNTCKNCGLQFGGRKKKHCSEVCCREWNKKNPTTYNKVCQVCGKKYIANKRKNQKCCSSKCQAVVSNRRLVEKLAKEKRICKGCGYNYIPIRFNQEYCSKNCRDKVYARKNPDYASAKRHRYRSRLVSAEYEEIDASEIYERDAWRCGICGKRINKKLKYPDPLSPTLDHIIPLSLGGSHTKDNLQLAHYICNITKGNRSIMPNDKGQLMMV